MKSKPIKPEEVVKKKSETIPDVVIDSFNELIAENYLNNLSSVKVRDVVQRIRNKDKEVAKIIYKKGWLGIENIYEEAGWSVSFEQPDRDESFDSYFSFSVKK